MLVDVDVQIFPKLVVQLLEQAPLYLIKRLLQSLQLL